MYEHLNKVTGLFFPYLLTLSRTSTFVLHLRKCDTSSHFHICYTFHQHYILFFSIHLGPSLQSSIFNLQSWTSTRFNASTLQLIFHHSTQFLSKKIVLREYPQGKRFSYCTESFLLSISLSGNFQLNVGTLKHSTRLSSPNYFAKSPFPSCHCSPTQPRC